MTARAAPARFPYTEHRTMAEVMEMEKRLLTWDRYRYARGLMRAKVEVPA